ncbi:hypothetical protein AB0J14_05075 [Micromonospora arborensis]|uniref:hypothetical protein n=1 Tax=Micromonospora arborensis TaxID=2116518 RepID=UPI00340A1042
MTAVTMLQVLTDVAAGQVTADQHQTFTIPSTVPTDLGEAYRLLLVDATTHAWVMRPAADTQPGLVVMVLTSVGEFVHARMNPDRYTSSRRFEVRDGKVSTQAVRL